MEFDAPTSFAGVELSRGDARFWLDSGDVLAEVRDPWETLAAKPVEEQPSSVGLVCVCGNAVASIPGTTASCRCGRIWIVSALRIAGP